MANNYIYFAMCELFKKKRKSVSILLSLTPKIYRKLLLTRVMERISRKKRLYFKGKCMNDEDVHGPFCIIFLLHVSRNPSGFIYPSFNEDLDNLIAREMYDRANIYLYFHFQIEKTRKKKNEI